MLSAQNFISIVATKGVVPLKVIEAIQHHVREMNR